MTGFRFKITCPKCGGPLEPGRPSEVASSGRAAFAEATCQPCAALHYVVVTLTTAKPAR